MTENTFSEKEVFNILEQLKKEGVQLVLLSEEQPENPDIFIFNVFDFHSPQQICELAKERLQRIIEIRQSRTFVENLKKWFLTN